MGSSPHTRDKWKDLLGDCLSDGITPAYAGQIVKTKEFEAFPRDHPRIRGTNPLSIHQQIHSARITPAYAGQILLYWLTVASLIVATIANIVSCIKSFLWPDAGLNRPALLGSPPHTRDKSSSNSVPFLLYGITPAYAGQIQKDNFRVLQWLII